jgi:hypothetical protein
MVECLKSLAQRAYVHYVWFELLAGACTEGSKGNIRCCALLAWQVHATFASDLRMWRASAAWIWRINVACKICVYDVRHVARVSCAPDARGSRNKGCYFWTILQMLQHSFDFWQHLSPPGFDSRASCDKESDSRWQRYEVWRGQNNLRSAFKMNESFIWTTCPLCTHFMKSDFTQNALFTHYLPSVLQALHFLCQCWFPPV